MPGNSVTVTLPWGKTVVVQSYANASFLERVTLQPAGGQPVVFTGTGFYDNPMGQTTIQTPASGTGAGYTVTVTVDHSSNGGASWAPSQAASTVCQLLLSSIVVVASEDGTDNSWDDCTTYFTWGEPPPDAGQTAATRMAVQAEAPQYDGRA
jgi:hypothetical protein